MLVVYTPSPEMSERNPKYHKIDIMFLLRIILSIKLKKPEMDRSLKANVFSFRICIACLM